MVNCFPPILPNVHTTSELEDFAEEDPAVESVDISTLRLSADTDVTVITFDVELGNLGSFNNLNHL